MKRGIKTIKEAELALARIKLRRDEVRCTLNISLQNRHKKENSE